MRLNVYTGVQLKWETDLSVVLASAFVIPIILSPLKSRVRS
jgi:hypothetical protein